MEMMIMKGKVLYSQISRNRRHCSPHRDNTRAGQEAEGARGLGSVLSVLLELRFELKSPNNRSLFYIIHSTAW